VCESTPYPTQSLSEFESKSPMEKRQLIEQIRQFNTSVEPQFLAQFDDMALAQYLSHLKAAQDRHIRIAGWVRQRRESRLKKVS